MANLGFWLGFLKVLLGLAANVAGIIRTKQAMDAGAKAEIGRQLVQVMARVGVTEQVRQEIAGMTDDALDDELRGP